MMAATKYNSFFNNSLYEYERDYNFKIKQVRFQGICIHDMNKLGFNRV